MAVKKRTTGAISADATVVVGCGASYANLRRVDVVSSADTSTAVTITDADSVVVFTLASGDHTTKKRQYPIVLNASTKGTDGSAVSGTDSTDVQPVVKGPLSIAISGIGSGTVTVDAFVDEV